MSDKLLEKVRERVLRILRNEDDNPGKGDPPIDRILAEVETALVLARREEWVRVATDGQGSYNHDVREHAAKLHPLPARTRQVLHEESDPHGLPIVYAYFTDTRRVMARGSSARVWSDTSGVLPFGGTLHLTAERIDLWAALKADPHRIEQVPADEHNPWGERQVD